MSGGHRVRLGGRRRPDREPGNYGIIDIPSRRLLVIDAEAIRADILDELADVGVVIAVAGELADISTELVDVRPIASIDDEMIVDGLAERIVIEVLS